MGRPFSCSPDPVANLCLNISHGLSASLQFLLVYYQLRQTNHFFSDDTAILCSSQRSVVDLVADCSAELHCHHNSHGCTVLSNILSICSCRISCSSIKHFPDLSGINEDLPCFSEVRSFTRLYAFLLLFLLGKFQFSPTEHLSSALLLSSLPSESSCLLPSILLRFLPFTAFSLNIFFYHRPMAFSCEVPSQVSH